MSYPRGGIKYGSDYGLKHILANYYFFVCVFLGEKWGILDKNLMNFEYSLFL